MITLPIWEAMLLGILQGLTEFLPISSSAHLVLVRWLFGRGAGSLTFDVMLHVGTLLALLVFFRQQWRQIGWQFLNRFRRTCPGPEGSSPELVDALILGTVPALLVGGWFQETIEDHLRSPTITLAMLLALAAAARLFNFWQLLPTFPHLGLPLFFGVIFSFISGFLCVKYLLRFLTTHTYLPFVVYRLLLAALLWVWLLL